MTNTELRQKFLDFFESKGHKVLPSSSLVPEHDPSVLFTTAGMHQFKRYYLFPEEALSKRITTCQKCIRTGDIDEVGDESHLTFFEMLGNFSFGLTRTNADETRTDAEPYYKEEAIEWAWEFLTKESEIDEKRISATYFKGEDEIPADTESYDIIRQITGLPENCIKGTGKEETFWSLGTEGSPGGPTVEFYIDGVEIWNLVFNQYVLKDGKYIKSEYQGVDTGMGLERLLAVLNGEKDVFKTDLFASIIEKIEKNTGSLYGNEAKTIRRLADHYRATVEIIETGIVPGKNGRESVLRTLLRVMFLEIKYLMQKDEEIQYSEPGIGAISQAVDNQFKDYSAVVEQLYYLEDKHIKDVVMKEYQSFLQLKNSGMIFFKENIHKDMVTGEDVFKGKDTFGLSPKEVVVILEKWGGKKVESNWEQNYKVAFDKHRKISKANAGMFKGGLADNDPRTTQLHTAAHLLLAGLRKILGDHVVQRGSNITSERLRFDFSHPEKVTDGQLKQVEDFVNGAISKKAEVKMAEMSVEEAKKSGAHGTFDERYGDKVKVYSIVDASTAEVFSIEICGGPHVKNTFELGHFKITNEESSSAGVRRIKAVLEK